MTRHIVWDWNGTLFNDMDAVTSATNEALADLGVAPITSEDHRRLFTRPVWVFYERLLGRGLVAGEFDRIDRAFHLAYRRSMHLCCLAVDAEATLRTAHRDGKTQSLLSMWQHDQLVPLVTELGIAATFVRVDGLRAHGSGEPKATYMIQHLDALELDPAGTLVVGDSVDDAHAAAHVGAACVLYSHGYHSRKSLEATGVPVVDTLSAALAWA